jgi:peptide/nickel transport system substrate-binding protein
LEDKVQKRTPGQWRHLGRWKPLSRRTLLKRAALGLSAAGARPLAAETAHAQAPKRGGRLRIGWSGHSANDTLQPTRLIQNFDFLRAYSVMSPLVKWGRKFEATPDLALAWEAMPDAATWFFRLRDGVTFHNGKTLTSEDVIYSLNLHRGPKSTSLVKSYFEDVIDIVPDGSNGIKITLKAPNADFPVLLGDPHTVIVPKEFVSWDKPVGTGPFQLVNFRPGIGMLVKRFPDYYSANTVYFDEVESWGIGDSVARINALLSGDVDYIVRVDAKSTQAIKETTGFDLVVSKISRQLCINTRADVPPFDNLDLRTALKYAVDREAMVKNLLQGYGQVANDLPVGSLDKYFCASIPQRPFDLDRARFLFKRSGHSGPLEIFASDVNYGAAAVDYAVHLQATAAKAGIDITVTRLPVDGYYAAVGNKKNFYVDSWYPRPTLDLILSSVNLTDSPQHETGYNNPKIDAFAIEARRMLDGPLRAEIYCQLLSILHEEDGRMIPVFVDVIVAKSDKLQGVVPHPFSEASGLRLCEEAWFA